MIWGFTYHDANRPAAEADLEAMRGNRTGPGGNPVKLIRGRLAVGMLDEFPGECDAAPEPVTVAFQGRLSNAKEISDCLGGGESLKPAGLLARAYRRWGESFVERLEGSFAFFLADPSGGLSILGRDRFGVETLFYAENGDGLVFGSRLGPVLRHPGMPRTLNFEAMHQYLLFCYNPTPASFFQGVRKLEPAHTLVTRNGASRIFRYWKLSFSRVSTKAEGETAEALFEILDRSVGDACDPSRRTGVFLSGGMDSSSVTSLASRHAGSPLRTFSFRCRGESFDESGYAKIVSDAFHTTHSLVEYRPETVRTMADLVGQMDEPFCDVGINLATDILGREASGKVDLVLTGDGGDELFGGHPVYQADRAAAVLDRIPRALLEPVYWLGSKLPDSDRKKDWKVKWKRFSRSVRFPAALYSHRWRIYYTENEMRVLLNPSVLTQIDTVEPYRDLLRMHAEADGRDALSRSIYSDYHTVVGFYLRRMGLIRRFGIEARFPLLDRRAVEFCAAVPSGLKIKNGSDVKYIFKKAMQNALPREIVFRKDKLGHSIPLKNWMRDDPGVREWILELLSEPALRKRQYFNPEAVNRMVREHLTKRENHSHRLWTLAVLELWLREHVDR
jgi:asparagine synthase (glutamine-hydrolysing)